MIKIKPPDGMKLIQIKPSRLRGVNPELKYISAKLKNDTKYFSIPRFCTEEMKTARKLNRIAQKNDVQKRVLNFLYSNDIQTEDYERLTADDVKSTFKHVFWINPNDNKGYHLLDEGRRNGLQKLRILDENGNFVKNAKVPVKKVILGDIKSSQKLIPDISKKYGLTHIDIIKLIARRYNPFAKYIKIIRNPKEKPDVFYKELVEKTDDKTVCICSSFGWDVDYMFWLPPEIAKKGLQIRIKSFFGKKIYNKENSMHEKLGKKTRILYSIGDNDSRINSNVVFANAEGVGGLDENGKVHQNCSPHDSLFVQHYEPYDFEVNALSENVLNITGLYGGEVEFSKGRFEKGFYGLLCGTSFSAPVRAAKIALAEMMKGVL